MLNVTEMAADLVGSLLCCSSTSQGEFLYDINGNETSTDDEELFPSFEFNAYKLGSFLCGIVLIPIAIFGLFGNTLAILIFSRKDMRSSINVLLVGLAAFDIWLLLTATPIFSAMGISAFLRRTTLQSAVGFLTLYLYPICAMAQSASAWTMIIISVERYLAVCRPFIAMTVCSVKRANIALVAVLSLAITYNVCRFYEYSQDETHPFSSFHVKAVLRDNPLYVKIYINWLYLLIMFVIPFGCLSSLNCAVIVGLRRASVERRLLTNQCYNEHKTAAMMVVLMLIFLLCNFMSLILNAIETINAEVINSFADYFFLLTDVNNLLVETNSSVNILVYYYGSKKFRKRANELCCSIMSKSYVLTRSSTHISFSSSVYQCENNLDQNSFVLVASGRERAYSTPLNYRKADVLSFRKNTLL